MFFRPSSLFRCGHIYSGRFNRVVQINAKEMVVMATLMVAIVRNSTQVISSAIMGWALRSACPRFIG